MSSFSGARRAICSAAILVVAFSVAQGRAQSDPVQHCAAGGRATGFEVAVIRPNPGDTTGHSHIWSAATDGHFKAQNVTALALIQFAYALPELRISGGPAWMRSTKFDMEAKSDPTVDEQLRALDSGEARQRKQRMLQDRFALKVHEESRTLPVYALVVAKGGRRFQTSNKGGTSIRGGNAQIAVQGSDHTMRLLAEQLSRTLGRIVLDKTGLDGRFDLTLKWTPDDVASTDPANGPSIFTAIQEQLGLKLESEKGPVTVLVIDHIELPSQN